MSFWLPRASKMHSTSDRADIAKTYEHCWFLLDAHFGSLEELLAELLAGWMAANPSRPSLLNKTLLTPLFSSHFFCFPNLFSFSFLWSGRARALPLRPTPPTPPEGPFGPPSQPQRPKCTEHAYNFKYVYDVIFPV